MTKQQIEAFKKITPGKWQFIDLRHQKNGQIIIKPTDCGSRIANVLTGRGFVRTERAIDCEANATAFAALPDLLAEREKMITVLKNARDRMVTVGFAISQHGNDRAALRAVIELLSEAEGGE